MRHMGSGGIAPPFLTLQLYGDEWSASRSCRFTLGNMTPSTHWIGGWVSSRAGLDVTEDIKISCPCRKTNPGCSARSLVAILVQTELSRFFYLYHAVLLN
jgi:hypothetical protein